MPAKILEKTVEGIFLKQILPKMAPSTAGKSKGKDAKKLTYCFFAYIITLIMVIGNSMASALACASFWLNPSFFKRGTAKSPPPVPSKLLIHPIPIPIQTSLSFFKIYHRKKYSKKGAEYTRESHFR